MKRYLSTIRIALRALEVNKARSTLTMLGIVIGVAAVIATVAVGSGATQRVQQQIASIGSNVIIIIPGSLTTSGLRMGTGNALTLTESDAKDLLAQCPEVGATAPVVRGGAQIVYGDSNWATAIVGSTPAYLTIRELTVAQGAAFTDHDVDSASKVALLGQTVVSNLFAGSNAVGQTIRIKHVPFTVVGVLSRKGQSPTGQDQDDLVLVPVSTAKRKLLGISSANADAVNVIMMQAKDSSQIQAAQDSASLLLRQRHHLQTGQDDDFSIRNMGNLLQG
jgi:putative ABC transport system permease protein